MGKPLIQQRRGKGSPSFRAPSHRFLTEIAYPEYAYKGDAIFGQVTAILDDPGRTAPVAVIQLIDGRHFFAIACEGIAIGDKVPVGTSERPVLGGIVPLSQVPEGTPIFDVELAPGDGGKIARSSGTSAMLVSHDEDTGYAVVQFSSKKIIHLSPKCLATIGVAAGGGRLEKPFLKAGNASKAAHARGKYYPHVRGTAMSAYDHPHGGKSLGKSSTVSRNTPPGRKVGHVAARTTGRRKSKRGAAAQGQSGARQ